MSQPLYPNGSSSRNPHIRRASAEAAINGAAHSHYQPNVYHQSAPSTPVTPAYPPGTQSFAQSPTSPDFPRGAQYITPPNGSPQHAFQSHSRNSSYPHSSYRPSAYPESIPEHSYLHVLSQHQPYPAGAGALQPIQTTHTIDTPSSLSPVSPASSSSTTSTDRYVCERCGRSFTRAHDRKRHFETHHLSNPAVHRCRNCDKSFSRSDSLRRHVNNNGCSDSA